MAAVVVKHHPSGGPADPTALVDGPTYDADPHIVTGLENVDNTSDANKPVSTAQAAALAAEAALARNASNLTGGIVPTPRLSFTQVGTGAVTRTMQDKARDIVGTADFGTATQAAAAVTAASSGGTIIVPNGAAPTLPASYPGVAFDYYGPATPVSLYEENVPDAISARLFRGQLPVDAGGTAQSILALECRAEGSTLNGPSHGVYALAISATKRGLLGTPGTGEIGGLNIAIRNNGPQGGHNADTSAFLANVGNYGTSGYAVGVEGVTTNFNAAATLILKQVGYQIGAIDGTLGNATALSLSANAGAIDNGIFLQSGAAGASFTNVILYKNSSNVTKFNVDGSGNITGNDLTIAGTTWTTSFTPVVTVTGGTGTATCRYKKIGTVVLVQTTVTITAGGTITSVTIPVASATGGMFHLTGREVAHTGAMWNAGVGVGNVVPSNYANSATVVTGDIIQLNGTYECA